MKRLPRGGAGAPHPLLIVLVALAGTLALPVASATAATTPTPQYAVTATVAVGNQPTGMAVDPATHDIYVANSADSTVSEIDGATNTVLGTVPIRTVGNNLAAIPGGMAVDPLSGQVFIANFRGPIYTMNGTTLALNTGYTSTGAPNGALLDQSDHLLYALVYVVTLAEQYPAIDVISEASGDLLATVPLDPAVINCDCGNAGGGIAVDPSRHRLYVDDNGYLYMLDTRTDKIADTVQLPAYSVGGVAVDPTVGQVYVSSMASGAVWVLDETTETFVHTIDAGFSTLGMAVDPDTHALFVADQGSGTGAPPGQLVIIDDHTDTVSQDITLPGAPNSVAVDPGTHLAYVNLGLAPDIDVVGIPSSFGPGTTAFASSTYTTMAGRPATITVDRTGSTAGKATVDYATSNGTAVAGTDYTATRGTLTFAPGASSATFTVATAPHGALNAQPTVDLALTRATGGVRFPARATLTLWESVPPQLTAETPPTSAVIGRPYSYRFRATGTPAPTFSVSQGSLPPGLSLDRTTGTLSGTPTVSGSSTFSVTAANGSYLASSTPPIVFTVDQAPTFTADSPPTTGAAGSTVFYYTYTASGVPAPTFYLASGVLPPGLELLSEGILEGTPAGPGTFTFRVGATNGVAPDALSPKTTLTITGTPVVPGAPTIGAATAGDTTATVDFTPPGYDGGSAITGYTVTAAPGGQTVTGHSSPLTVPGLTDGVAYTFTVTATNAVGTSYPSAASNAVTPDPTAAAAPVFTAHSPPTFIPGDAEGGSGTTDIYTFAASGNPAPTFSLGASSPTWLSIDPTTGELTGVAPYWGTTVTYTVLAANPHGQKHATFTLNVGGPPDFTADSPPLTFTAGQRYQYTFAATGYPPPTFSLEPGAPTWLSIGPSSGVVSGTPPAGTTSFAYGVTIAASGFTLSTDPYTVTLAAGGPHRPSGPAPG